MEWGGREWGCRATLDLSTLEGRSTFTEAFGLLGFHNMKTFRELSAQVR